MQFPPETQIQAQNLYFNAGKPSGEIAQALGVSRKTVYRWIKEGKWEEMKIAAAQAPGILLQNMYNHIDEVNKTIRKRHLDDRCPTMEEIDKLRKLVNITRTVGKISAGAYMQSFQELSLFIAAQDPELSQKVDAYAENYIKANMTGLPYYTKPNLLDPASGPQQAAPLTKKYRTPKCMLKTHEEPEPPIDKEAYVEWRNTLNGFLRQQGIEPQENVEEPWPIEEENDTVPPIAPASEEFPDASQSYPGPAISFSQREDGWGEAPDNTHKTSLAFGEGRGEASHTPSPFEQDDMSHNGTMMDNDAPTAISDSNPPKHATTDTIHEPNDINPPETYPQFPFTSPNGTWHQIPCAPPPQIDLNQDAKRRA